MAAGHRLRRTGKDFEMDVFTEEEVRVFCKRTQQIEDLEKRLRNEPSIMPSNSHARGHYRRQLQGQIRAAGLGGRTTRADSERLGRD